MTIETSVRPWLLLIHQIPPKPDYLRVKIGRRLQRIGAVAVKNSVYVLPDSADTLEDFQWVRAEIVESGGDATICRVDFVDGLTDEHVEFLFRSARDAEYAEIASAAREAWMSARGRDRDASARAMRADDELKRLRKRIASVRVIDFCDAPGRPMAEDALQTLALELGGIGVDTEGSPETGARSEYRGRRWVTRRGVFVDRMASAWLIRRFIDRDARFGFVNDDRARVADGDLRFDMFGGEFTHVGDRCTFETLLDRFGIADDALTRIAEIVHDIDLKDEKFGHDEAAGIERVLSGIAAAHADDEARLVRGAQLFDELYALFSRNVP